MEREQELREIREAIDAGDLTLQHLNQARKELNSASNFGIADMIGFDLIGDIGKHVKLGKAQKEMEAAKSQVMCFQRELKDVSSVLNFHVDIGNFLTFADFFFDGLFMDVFVQSKIGDAKRQVDSAIDQINRIMDDLYRMEREVEGR